MGSQTASTGRGPGWFARRPAIIILSSSLHVFRSIQPLAGRLPAWSRNLALRWLPRQSAGKVWQGRLDLSARPTRTFGTRLEPGRAFGRTSGIVTRRNSLQTLSLPEGLRIEEPSSGGWQEQNLHPDTDQGSEPPVVQPDGGILSTDIQAALAGPITPGQPILPDQALPPADRLISASSTSSQMAGVPRPAIPQSTGSRAQKLTPGTPQKISPPAWPFRLVSLVTEKMAPDTFYPRRGKAEFRKPPLPSLPGSEPLVSEQAASRFVARSRASQIEQDVVAARLFPRPITAEQPSITTTHSTITTLPSEPAALALILFEGHRQPYAQHSSKVPSQVYPTGQSTAWPELHSAGSKFLQRKPVQALEDQAYDDTKGISLPALTRAFRKRTSAQPGEPSLFEPTSQVRPPGAMLTLLTPRQPEAESTVQPIISSPVQGMVFQDRPGSNKLQRLESQAEEPSKLVGQPSGSPSFKGLLEQEWPLLSVLHRLETQPEEPAEPAAVQVLRRMWPEAAQLVRSTLQALASSGPGERLPVALRENMQARLGRDLSDVRLHTSPLVQTLRAEAFTSGRNVVFAPGRLDVSTGKGLALLGHELTHIGQPLAFKQESSASQVFEDSAERTARRQEEGIQYILEHGWPKTHSMELQHPARQATAQVHGGSATSSFVQRLANENSGPSQSTDMSGSTPAPGAGNTPSGQAASPLASPGPSGAPAPDANMDTLARQVYGILKNRLRAEHDRHQLYNF